MATFTRRFRPRNVIGGVPGAGGLPGPGTPIVQPPAPMADSSLYSGENAPRNLDAAQAALLGYDEDFIDRILTGTLNTARGMMGGGQPSPYSDWVSGLGLSPEQLQNVINTRAELRSGRKQAYYNDSGLLVVDAGTDPGTGYKRLGGGYNNPAGGAAMKNPLERFRKRPTAGSTQPKSQVQPTQTPGARYTVPRGNTMSFKRF